MLGLYRNWEILTAPGAPPDPKREGFLRNIFGAAELRPNQLVAKRGDTILPLFELGFSDKPLLVSARGFGSKQAKKLKGPLGTSLIMGICLWDNRWKLESRDGKVYSPVFWQERRCLASERPEIAKVKIPSFFGEYHRTLIRFQAATVKGLENHRRKNAGKIYYHLPRDEYLLYIDGLPIGEGAKEELRKELNNFCLDLSLEIERKIGEVEFISPLLQNRQAVQHIQRLTSTELEMASFLYPYVFLADNEGVIGVEDLIEYSLLTAGERIARQRSRRSQYSVRGVFAMLGVPYCYDFPLELEVKTFLAITLNNKSIVLLRKFSAKEIEDLLRRFFKENGSEGLLIGYPIKAGDYAKVGMRNTLSLAIKLGQFLEKKNLDNILQELQARVIAREKIQEVALKSGGDFLEGFIYFKNFKIFVKNENIALFKNLKRVAAVPDLIVLLGKNFRPIHNTEISSYKGKEVMIIYAPAFGYWQKKENRKIWHSALE